MISDLNVRNSFIPTETEFCLSCRLWDSPKWYFPLWIDCKKAQIRVCATHTHFVYSLYSQFHLTSLAFLSFYSLKLFYLIELCVSSDQIRSVAQSCPTLRPHESQHARPHCPSPTPRVHSDSRPSSQWCHPALSSSVVPFSSCPLSLPASQSFPMSQLFTWGTLKEIQPVHSEAH